MDKYIIENARLDFCLKYSHISYDDVDDEVTLCMQLKPAFTGFNTDDPYEETVFDIQELSESVLKEGEYYLINCECGDPAHGFIYDSIKVSFSDNSVIWDIPIQKYLDALKEPYKSLKQTYLSLVFDKEHYRAQVIKMAQAYLDRLNSGVLVKDLKCSDFTPDYKAGEVFEDMKQERPEIQHIRDFEINPDYLEIDELERIISTLL
ncbi:TPA: hypothetical protein QB352_000840 [Pasteurella multocida]|nr:hypothetical protein [Pasteurella multocida]